MFESVEHSNLDQCRKMMALSSSSDLCRVVGTAGNCNGVAELAIKLAKDNAPDDFDKLMFDYLVDEYIIGLDNAKRLRFFNRAKRQAYDILGKHGFTVGKRKKRAVRVAEVAIQCTFHGNLSDTERAEKMGISKSSYSERYAEPVNELMGEWEYYLAVADGLVKMKLKK